MSDLPHGLTPGSVTPQGLEPASDAAPAPFPRRPVSLRSGLWITIRGRGVRLRGLRRTPSGVVRWLAVLGPGLIASAAGNDAGGIATYSAAGARFGYDFIWVMIVMTLALGIVQEMCARLGAATGRGLLDLIRERFGINWALVAIGAVMIANGGLVVTEFLALGAAVNLLGLPAYAIVPLAALVLWYVVIFGSYSRVEGVFIVMTMVFFAYPVAAILAHPDWHALSHAVLRPKVHFDPDYLLVLVGLLGTTITPYMQIFQQSSIVEKGVARRHYGPERIDTWTGVIFSNLMSIAMIVATAATLYVTGHRDVQTAADAARALEPVAGHFARTLFAVGLIGASLLAAAVLPLATSYAVAEAFGFPKGVNLDFRRARLFFGLFTALIAGGAALAMIPGLPVMRILLLTQVLNGLLLPIVLVFIMLLANDRRLAGNLANGRLANVLGWGTVIVATIADLVLLVSQAVSGK